MVREANKDEYLLIQVTSFCFLCLNSFPFLVFGLVSQLLAVTILTFGVRSGIDWES